jgi:D-glycero-D-manno-heptose 1,7-bisphosphate phosphatase
MKIVILDRDGVINQDSAEFIKSPDEWIPIPDSLEAIARLHHAGFRVYIASNQSGIGRGLFDIETLNNIHQRLIDELQKKGGRIDAILFCPHAPDQHCDCRKPRPGLYLQIARRTKQSLINVPVIGDSMRDLEAAITVGARPLLVRTGKGEQTLLRYADFLTGITCFDNLSEAVNQLISEASSADQK